MFEMLPLRLGCVLGPYLVELLLRVATELEMDDARLASTVSYYWPLTGLSPRLLDRFVGAHGQLLERQARLEPIRLPDGRPALRRLIKELRVDPALWCDLLQCHYAAVDHCATESERLACFLDEAAPLVNGLSDWLSRHQPLLAA